MINSGQLDSQVSFESPTITRNAMGDPIKTWAVVATRRARVNNQSRKERERLGSDLESKQEKQFIDVLIRYDASLSGIDSSWTLVWEGDRYQINEPEIRGNTLRSKEMMIRAWRNRVDG